MSVLSGLNLEKMQGLSFPKDKVTARDDELYQTGVRKAGFDCMNLGLSDY